MLLIITAPSAGGKTTLQQELVERGYKTPINFTTRPPRTEKEKDDYVFISKEMFFKKLANGDFMEFTEYNGNFYAASKHLPEGNVVMVLDPVGRNQIMEKYARAGKSDEVVTIYLNISPEIQAERLEERRSSVKEIEQRKLDFDWFDKTKFCLELDGDRDVVDLADHIELYLSNMKR